MQNTLSTMQFLNQRLWMHSKRFMEKELWLITIFQKPLPLFLLERIFWEIGKVEAMAPVMPKEEFLKGQKEIKKYLVISNSKRI